MKQPFQAIIDAATAAAQADESNTLLIASLHKQVFDLTAAAKIVTISGIQSVAPESLWFEARDARAPKSGPHGVVNIFLGEPSVADFHPTKLMGGFSDNVYNLRRLYLTLSPAQQEILESAKNFSIGCEVSLDPLSSAQAFELDLQTRKRDGTVINVGPQLIPDHTGGWQLRGFDFVNKDWVPLGAKAQPVPGKTIAIQVDATCDGKIVQFVRVIVGGVETPVTFSHPVSMDKPGASYLNGAYQLDATVDAKPYKATVGHMTIVFS